jgi:hypothetical protein
MEGNIMLQNKIKIYGMDSPTKNPSRQHVTGFFNTFNSIGASKPLYCFTLPGFILGAAGIYMGFQCVHTFYHGGSFVSGYIFLSFLFTLLGTSLAFVGILLNSIAGLIKYRSNQQ